MNAKVKAGFVYTVDIIRNGKVVETETVHNLMPAEALNYLLSAGFKQGTQYATWYAGLFSGNYTPTGSETMATFPSSATEFTSYTNSSRPAVIFGSPANGQIDNSASLIELTFSDDTIVYGGFLASSSGKGATTGVLGSVVRFASPKQPGNGGILRISVAQQLINS